MRSIVSILLFCLGSMLVYCGVRHLPAKSPVANDLLVPPSDVKYFSLGYNEMVADTFWLRVVQDFDSCGRDQADSTQTSPIVVDAINSNHKQRKGRCELSWVYKMIDAVTELAPRFREPYSSGAVMLSVAVDDIQGASNIYEKALKQFAGYWPLEYQAAYHFLYETGDKKRAAELLISAGKDGAPSWVPVLAARLYSRAGAATLAKSIMKDFLEKNPELVDNAHIKQRMAEIEADLKSQDGPDASTPPAVPAPGSPEKSPAH